MRSMHCICCSCPHLEDAYLKTCQEKLTDENSYKYVKQNMSTEIMSDKETDKKGELEGDRGLIKRPLAFKADPLTKVKKSFDRYHESGLAAFQKGKDVRYYWTS